MLIVQMGDADMRELMYSYQYWMNGYTNWQELC